MVLMTTVYINCIYKMQYIKKAKKNLVQVLGRNL